MKSFDLNSCRRKLEDHYQKTATVPTSVWSKKSVVDIHQIYTRLSWVKEEQTPTGTTQSELKHYTELFTANKNGVIPKRILVQGQTGIGKSTFVKKLLVDWVEVNKGAGDEQAAVLKNFELVVAVNLKEVSKCQSLIDVITQSNVFAKEDKYMTEDLLGYITNNQEKVLLIFDGYDEYRCGRESEIYEIFSGKSLRSCSVLLTTRISKADELRGGEDLHAEITGFSKLDRRDFMRRFLNSEEVSKLEDHLCERKLGELAKVPLLLLFFSILWREGQSKSFPKSKTMLYIKIVQFILNHSHSRQTEQHVKLESFKDSVLLSEIGKVALQGLLKDDHLFEYSQLSKSVRSDESVFTGLLQITEYSENSGPVGMVSFIHKSIQEFLATWYVTYTCILKDGSLGLIGVKFEDCMALEDVFSFVCGLSHNGALATFRHLKSVRMSDPSLDLSKTVPDEGSETDAPLSDVTDCQRKFNDLVSNAFEEVESKSELSRACLDSLGSILLVSESFPDYLLVDAIDTNTWSLVSNGSHWYFGHRQATISRLYEIVKKLITQGSEVLKVAEFLEKFVHFSHCSSCDFSFVLCFRNGQVYLYITHLTDLRCDNHARLITDNIVSSQSVQQSSGHLSLKFLKTLESRLIKNSMKSLGSAIKNCNHLEHIEVSHGNSSLSHILKHVSNPRRCSLSISYCSLTSKGAVELASLLPKFERVIRLSLFLAKCPAEAVTRLVASIKHNTLEDLELSEINLTTAAAEALGQSLSELSALQKLEISGVTLYSAEAGTRLFAGIKHKTLEDLELSKINLTTAAAESLGQSLSELSALKKLEISDVTLCSAKAGTRLFAGIKHKTLEDLELSKINLTTAAAESLGQSLSELSPLKKLEISDVTLCSAEAGTSLFAGIKHKTLEYLELSKINLTTAAAESLGQSLSELSALKKLEISDVTLCSAEAGTRLFAGIKHKTPEDLELPEINLTTAAAESLGQSLSELSALQTLEISGVTLCSAEAGTSLFAGIKHKTLEYLELSKINLTTAAAESLGKSLSELSALRMLEISGVTLCSADAGTSLFAGIKHKTLKVLRLREINLTTAAVEALCQSLSKLSALRRLEISGVTFCSAEAGTRLFAGIKHKTLEDLKLSEINLTTAAAESLGQSLPELSALQTLKVSGLIRCSDDAVTRLITAIKHKTLEKLELCEMNLTPTAAVALGQSLRELPSLQNLTIGGSDGCSLQLEFSVFRKLKISGVTKLSAEAVARLIDVIKQKPLEKLELSEVQCPTSAIAKAFGQLLPELSALQTLKISGLAECPDNAVTKLVTAVKHKTLKELDLCEINLTLTIAESLAQSLPELPALQTLTISGLTECSDEAVTKLVSAFKHTTLQELELSEMNLTSAAAVMLGQSLPELPSLQKLEIRGSDGCSLQLEFPVLRELKIKRWPEFSAEAVTRLIDIIKHKPLEKLEISEIHLTSAVAEVLGQLLSEVSALQTLKISGVEECSDDAVTKLITAIKHKTLEKLELCEINLTSTVAELLAQSLPELSALRKLKVSGEIKCSDDAVTKLVTAIKHKTLEELELSEMKLTSAAAEALGQALPELSALQTLKISGLTECSDEAVTKLVSAIKHKTLEELELSEMSLSSTAGKALGQSLSELPSLRILKIIGSDGCSLQLGFPLLRELEISGMTEFSVEAVARLIDVFKNKPHQKLELSEIHLTSAIAEALVQLLPEVSALQTLEISGVEECSDDEVTKLITAIKHKTLEKLELCGINLTSTVAESLAQSLPELSALRKLKVSGEIKCSDDAVTKLVTAIKHKTLEELELSEMKLTSAAAEALGQALPELSALQTLKISGLTECSDEAVTKLVSAIKHKTLEELELSEMSLSSTAGKALGQSLSELPSLRILKIIGSDGCSLQLGFPLLRELEISGMTEFSVEAVARLIDVFKNKPHQKLELSEIHLTSAIAEALVQLLPEVSALQTLEISGVEECSDDEVTKLITAIKHKTLEKLELCGINLTSTVAESLAQSLPELSALRKLKVSGEIKCSDEVATRLGAVIKHKTIEKLDLSKIHLTSAVAKSLGQSLPELSALRTLKVSGLIKCSDDAVTRLVSAIKHKTLEGLTLSEINPTSPAAVILGHSLPELHFLQRLKISGSDGFKLHLRFPVFRELKISGVTEFSAEVVTRLTVGVIKGKPFEKLELSEINLTSAVAEALGQLLPELSALQTLEINGLTEWSDGAGSKFFAALKHKTLKELDFSGINVKPTATEALVRSLPELSALQTLKISGLTEWSDEAVTKLASAIKHKTLKDLELSEINLTSAAAVALVQSLSELPSLQDLTIDGLDGCNLQLELSVLPELTISGLTEFSAEAVTGLIDVIKNKPFEKLELSDINLTSAVAEALGQLLPELSALQTLEINGLTEWSDGAGTKFFAALKHKTLKELDLSEINVMSAATEALGQSLPELSALRSLKINGLDECRLQHKEVEALFGRFNRPSSIKELWLTGFTAKGSLAPLMKTLCLFPCLKVLKLEDLDMDEGDLSGLLENLKFTPDLRTLNLMGNPLGQAVRSMIPYLLEQQRLEDVYFQQGDCSEEDLRYVQEAIKEKRPQLKIRAW